jgi:diguanylate cyclase (GGDEF)-like protein
MSAAEADVLSLLADQSAPSVERVTRLVRGAGPEATYDLLDTVHSAIANSSSIFALFHELTRTISDVFDIGCALAVSAGEGKATVSAHHPIKEFADATGSWLAEILGNEEVRHRLQIEVNPIGYDQVLSDPGEQIGKLLATAPIRAVQLFPLATNGRWVGALLLFDDTLLKLDPQTRDALKRVAHTIGLALSGMLRRDVASTDDDQWRGWARIMTSLLAGEPLATMLHDVLIMCGETIDVDGALMRSSSRELDLPEGAILSGGTEFERIARALLEQGALDALLDARPRAEGEPDATLPATAETAQFTIQYGAPLLVPIHQGEARMGELALFRSNDRPFTQAEIADARQFASVIAVTIRQRQAIQLHSRQDRILETVRQLAERLNRASTQQAMAEITVEICADAFESGKATLHLRHEPSENLIMAAAYGMPLPFVTANSHLNVGTAARGTTAQRSRLSVIEDVTTDPGWMTDWHVSEASLSFRSVWSVPLHGGDDRMLGMLTIYHANPTQPGDDDVALLEILAHQIVSALERARLSDRSQDLYRATVESLAAAVDAKDPFTHNHSWLVSDYCRKIADSLDLTSSEIEIIELAGLLHDVGKIGIPDRVLQKPDTLSSDEWAMMQRHPDLGARILGDNPALSPVVPLVRHHHERFDGRGYPDQLSGDDIPLGAAIVGLADAFATMTTDRPYRRARTIVEAIEEIRIGSGSHFHPKIVEAFLRLLASGDIVPASRNGSRTTTRELDLKRVVGAEARGFGLLQRITTEIGALIDIDRFLHRLDEIMTSDFPDSVCEIFGQDPTSGNLIAVANQRRQKPLIIPKGQSIVGWVAAHSVSQNVADVLEDPRYMTKSHRLMRSLLAVPLVVDGMCIGVLSLEHPELGAYSPSDQHVLEIVATYVAQAIQVANLHDRLKRHASRDSLTGLPNHREFCRRLDEEIVRARTLAGQIAIAILDVQGLRAFNRSHGHAAGDEMLKTVAEVLTHKVRTGDTVARYGGDEFALLVPRVGGSLMRARLDAISEELGEARLKLSIPGIRFGIAAFPDDGTRAAEIIAAAETAMRDGLL